MRKIAAVCAVFWCIISGACSNDDTPAAATSATEDSAGVKIVRNGGPSGKPDSLLSFDETLRIGVTDENASGERFFQVRSIAVDDSGRVYVGDGSATVRVFDAAGKLIRTIGHKGRGPGEFQDVSAIFLRGDTVEVMDSFLGRISRFDAIGKMVGEDRIREQRMVAFPVARMADGWMAVARAIGARERFGMVQDTYNVVKTARMADLLTSESQPAGSSADKRIAVMTPRLFLLKSGYALSPLWDPQPAFSATADGTVYVHNGADYAISAYDSEGKLIRRILRAHTPVPVPPGLEEKYFAKVKSVLDTAKGASFSETGPNGETVTAPTDMDRKSVPHGKVLPTLAKMLVSNEGVVWVQRPDLSDEPLLLEFTDEGRPDAYWDVFHADGTYRGTVKLPRTFSSRAVTANSIFGVSRNADDIESIVAYTLKK
jgi:hypothetical protein